MSDLSSLVDGLIDYAVLAPNSHNSQPWRFEARIHVGHADLAIKPDFARRVPVADPDDTYLWASLGCAAENVVAAATLLGARASVVGQDGNGIRLHIARDGAAEPRVLDTTLRKQQSTRSTYDGRPLPALDLDALLQAAGSTEDGAPRAVFVDSLRAARLAGAFVAGNTAMLEHRPYRAELLGWSRFNERHARETGDGLLLTAFGAPALPTWLGQRVFDLALSPPAENAKLTEQISSSAGLIVFGGLPRGKDEFVQDAATRISETGTALDHAIGVGRACQRMLLEATARGISYAFVNQILDGSKIPGGPDSARELARFFGMTHAVPTLVLRVGYGRARPRSFRKKAARTG